MKKVVLIALVFITFAVVAIRSPYQPYMEHLIRDKVINLASGNILIGNSIGKAATFNPSGDVDISNTGTLAIQSGAVEAPMMDARDGFLKYASATIGFADLITAGNGVPHLAGPSIPDNSVIIKCWYEVLTTFGEDGDDSSTISIGLEDQDNDLVIAAAIKTGTPWDAATIVETIVANIDDPSVFLKLTAARQIAVTVDYIATDTVLDAGSMDVTCLYISGV